MTADKAAKRAARELAEREGISYTAARRQLAAAEAPLAPPRPYRTSAPCPHRCDGTAHPGLACWPWLPEDAKGTRWEVRQAADLPTGRADLVASRARDAIYGAHERRHAMAGYFGSWDHRWLLALVYAMLTDQHPELQPDPAALRAAVEADDLEAVDALMEPLDRAAARLMTKDPDQWWKVIRPRLDAYVATVEADDRELTTWREMDRMDRMQRLADQWRRVWEKTHLNMHGFYEAPGVQWMSPKEHLDVLLVARHGGHAPHARVRLADGRPAVVYAVEWGEAGPPVAYRVRELVQGEYTAPGHLIVAFNSDETVPAHQCHRDDTLAESER